jgi:hypothetical protein
MQQDHTYGVNAFLEGEAVEGALHSPTGREWKGAPSVSVLEPRASGIWVTCGTAAGLFVLVAAVPRKG